MDSKRSIMRTSEILFPLMTLALLGSVSCGDAGTTNTGPTNAGAEGASGAGGASLEQYTPNQANWSTFASKPREAGITDRKRVV